MSTKTVNVNGVEIEISRIPYVVYTDDEIQGKEIAEVEEVMGNPEDGMWRISTDNLYDLPVNVQEWIALDVIKKLQPDTRKESK